MDGVNAGRSFVVVVGHDDMQLFNEINLRNIRGDVFGGITAAVIALPMALAFGVASGAGPEAGLYGAILVGLFAALFGGSPCLMSEPTGPMTVVFTAVATYVILKIVSAVVGLRVSDDQEIEGLDIVLHEESLNRGSVIRNCSTSDIGTENSSTRFRCVDVTFENNHLEDFHFWFHAGSNGPRPRDIVIKNSYVSDQRIAKINFQQGLDCLLSVNEFDGVTLDFQKCEDMRVIGNRW